MFKIAFLLFIALVRGQTPLPGETVAGKYPVTAAEAPYEYECADTDWDNHAVNEEPGTGIHANPFYAVLAGDTGDNEASERCGEMFALFETEDDVFETPTYIIVAASEKKDSTALQIGDKACTAIENECTDTPPTFGVALKLPQLTVLPEGSTVDLCDGFNLEDSGEGENADSPYYVYVDDTSTQKLFAGLDHCGRLYQFGSEEKYVVVAGITDDGADGDGLELVIREEDCENLATCDLEGYAIWTGETFTLPEESTTEETDSPSPSETSPSETSPETSTESTTESTTSSRLPLDTTTEEDSTFFAAVGLTLFAILA